MKFSIKDFFSKCEQTADLFTFTKEILNGKLHFMCRIFCWEKFSHFRVIVKVYEN